MKYKYKWQRGVNAELLCKISGKWIPMTGDISALSKADKKKYITAEKRVSLCSDLTIKQGKNFSLDKKGLRHGV